MGGYSLDCSEDSIVPNEAPRNGSMNILQINTNDIRGGAANVAMNLFRLYRDIGHKSILAVGSKSDHDPDVIQIPGSNSFNSWRGLWSGLEGRCNSIPFAPVQKYFRHLTRFMGQPSRYIRWSLGLEEFDYPGTRRLLELIPEQPNILHCHNLHGGYFDLRTLPWLSRSHPLVLTLHDAWMIGGHCAHSLDCDRWKDGCGYCRYLSLYPAVRRDSTAENWRHKRDIYARCRLYIASPSGWLMDRVKGSILSQAIVDSRVIPNGVDLKVFHPGSKEKARKDLGLPSNARILLFVADGVKKNIWKDYETMRKALSLVTEDLGLEELLFIALGETASSERIGNAEVRFVPYQNDQSILASYYRASDVYIHAVRAETFGLVLAEASACGVPVVATDVGGIPEVIQDGKTGLLTPIGDPETMASKICQLIVDGDLRTTMGENAAAFAKSRFDINQQAARYLDWYEEILTTN